MLGALINCYQCTIFVLIITEVPCVIKSGSKPFSCIPYIHFLPIIGHLFDLDLGTTRYFDLDLGTTRDFDLALGTTRVYKGCFLAQKFCEKSECIKCTFSAKNNN